ncbi:MAG: efflux RND transporter periplasmic adaptor subunit [candidate division KSB1 bacterium]|nr:efflux RND transporter periplasmic adaptor subunit [candidate division KSB1 bacterium]MDZ7273225.1 efflux RND transporter periplasmic adaptor subunit [candidate division KSB1 bacterium]MDZ7285327.1 efflux RND transporter periplasmic adaptor subunit [candidate division KSB1 bacterium]MDZ7298359.1 efflux RND transporter periplasmic adaptor subunit [candidate division KSB1 bacterium]MDZ7308523.1 efflux RND transporter periplasmic adaptor subunit [candidate division KSB1 bacterium]
MRSSDDSSGLTGSLKKSLFRDRKSTTATIVAGLVVMLFVGNTLFSSEDADTSIPVARVKKGEVVVKVTELGELRAQDQVTISAPTDKQILYLAPEGTWVEEGDTLVRFESTKYVISTEEARSGLSVARANLAKAMSEYEAQKTREESARQRYESLPALAKKGFVVESEVEQARLEYLELQSRTKSAYAVVEAERANLERAQAAVEQQQRKLDRGTILAPRAGLVVYALVGNAEEGRKIEVGMTPFEGMDLMYLPDVSSMLVDIEISEVDLAKVQVGQPVEVRLDAYADVVFRGEVAEVGALAKRKISRITGKATGAKVFEVTIKVLDSDVRLKPGLTATTDIIVSKVPEALHIPLEAVFLDDNGKTVAYVRKGGATEVRPIVIGESNDRFVIVTNGLKEGEEVLLGRPSTI